MPRDKGIHRLLPVAIFLVALLFRLAPLGRYVTPDEPAWVLRSIRFGQALAAGDLAALPDTGHPGVTTTWLGGLGVQIHRWLDPEAAAGHQEWLDGLAGLSPTSPAAFGHLRFFLPAGRILVALSTSLGLVAVFALGRRLWGLPVAALGTFLLALDPFLAGHSGLLHVDGLLATTMTLSALAALLAVGQTPPDQQGETRRALFRWILLSGLFAGLAGLTKTPGGFMAFFALLVLSAGWLTRRLSTTQAITALLLWGLSAGLTFVALYPALWADPLVTLRGLLDVGGRHVEGALRPIFFQGRFTFTPGVSFYPVAGLWRVSPVVLVGLPLALVTHWRRPGSRRFTLLLLTALALGFGLLVTLVGKKHDRYLLPAFPPLILVAALGWESAGKWVTGKLSERTRRPNLPTPNPSAYSLLASTLLIAQLLFILPYRCTPLGYFNPLLGGPRAALERLPVGWGEGLGAAARWLNQQPQAPALIVASPSIPPFASLFVGQTVLLDERTSSQADYLVDLPQQERRQLAREPASRAPDYAFRVGGISHASVWRNPAPDAQAEYLAKHAPPGDLILLNAEAALGRRYAGPAKLATLTPAPSPVQAYEQLWALLVGDVHYENLWYVALPAASPITTRHLQDQLNCFGPPDSTETVAGAIISQIPLNPGHTLETCAKPAPVPYAARFSDHLALVDALLPADALTWPESLPVVVRWQALTPPPADYRAVLHLRDQSGHLWVEGGQELLDADYRRPTAWSPGHWTDQTFQLTLPPGLPPGRYSVELGLFDPLPGAALAARDAEGRFIGLTVDLGSVSVAPPPRPPAPAEVTMAERFDPPIAAGPLALLGHNPPPGQIASGDWGSFDLFWQANAPTDVDLMLRWRLNSTTDNAETVEAVPLSPYPTFHWRRGELEQVRYALPTSPDLAAGTYELSVNVLRPDGTPLQPVDTLLTRVEILARDRQFRLPSDIAYPLDLRLGDVVHLRGFDIASLSASPGDQIPLTLYWQADGPTDISYSLFVHLVGPDGMAHGQVDRLPANGAAPTHSWAPEQVIVDEIPLPVAQDAPPGTYYVAVGLYDPLSADRLPVYDAEGDRLPDDRIVLPVEITVP